MDTLAQAIDNQDVEEGFSNFADFIAMLWNGLEAFLGILPPIVLGGLVFILVLLWAFRRARHGH